MHVKANIVSGSRKTIHLPALAIGSSRLNDAENMMPVVVEAPPDVGSVRQRRNVASVLFVVAVDVTERTLERFDDRAELDVAVGDEDL